MKIKKLSVISLCMVILIAIFTGCSSTSKGSGKSDDSKEKEIPDLTGEWKQENNKSDDSYQAATIVGDTITIYWVSDNGETKSLYWAGSFVPPTTDDESYSWDSKNDHSKTESSLLASNDDSKTIQYKDGILSYEASAMGTTTTVKLKKS